MLRRPRQEGLGFKTSRLLVVILSHNKISTGSVQVREMAQQLRASAALAEASGPAPTLVGSQLPEALTPGSLTYSHVHIPDTDNAYK